MVDVKELYFTSENIDAVAKGWLRELAGFRKRHPLDLMKESAALIVIDMQRYFTDNDSHACVPSVAAIIPRLKEVVSAFVDAGLPVVFTRHVDIDSGDSIMLRWWEGKLSDEDELSGFTPGLLPREAVVMDKHHYDAFHGTELEDMLTEKGVRQVVIGGVMTHLCCESTARSAFVRNFSCFFLVDGTATYSADFHRASLLNLSHGFVVPVLCDEVVKCLRG